MFSISYEINTFCEFAIKIVTGFPTTTKSELLENLIFVKDLNNLYFAQISNIFYFKIAS